MASRILGGDFVGGESSSWWRDYRKPRGQVCVQTPPPRKKKIGQGASIHRLIEVWANKTNHFHEHVLLMKQGRDVVSLVLLAVLLFSITPCEFTLFLSLYHFDPFFCHLCI